MVPLKVELVAPFTVSFEKGSMFTALPATPVREETVWSTSSSFKIEPAALSETGVAGLSTFVWSETGVTERLSTPPMPPATPKVMNVLAAMPVSSK